MDNQPKPTQPNPAPAQPVQPVQPMQAIQNAAIPQSEFLNKMDVIHGTNAQPEKKGLSKGVIIGIIVGVLVVIGAVATVLILNMNQPKPKPSNPTPVSPVEPEDELDEEAKKRNILRANDMLFLANATNSFQANNRGELPGEDPKAWEWVIARYIEGGKLLDGATGEPYRVSKVCKFSEPCVDIENLTWETNHNEIYILINADCKGNTKADVTVSSTAKRRAAIFTIVEGDTFICATNN